VRAVWVNELGGVTYEVGTGPAACFVKWIPHTSGIDLDAEVVRLEWAAPFTAVPSVLGRGEDDVGAWLVTARVPGTCAVEARWRHEPERAVAGVGEGLRALHDALPVASCPFTNSLEDRIALVHARYAAGLLDPGGWHPEHRHLSLEDALARLDDAPSVERSVVGHGDACAPNTLLDAAGHCSGHVDLGALGVADRWADLAVATWSTAWNYGAGLDGVLLSAYGVEPDPARTAFYRLLWDLGP
jgi:kanamycin kinase